MGDGNMYVFTKEELDSLRPERSDVIEILHFVDSDEVEDLYYDKHYFVGPTRSKDRPYSLLLNALKRTGRMAIGKFIMREREYICAIGPMGKGLLLSTLHYSYEIRRIEDIKEVEEVPDPGEEEIKLAIQLIDHLYLEELDMDEFRDCYAERLKKAIESRDEDHVVVLEGEREATSDENLIDMLRASLEV